MKKGEVLRDGSLFVRGRSKESIKCSQEGIMNFELGLLLDEIRTWNNGLAMRSIPKGIVYRCC